MPNDTPNIDALFAHFQAVSFEAMHLYDDAHAFAQALLENIVPFLPADTDAKDSFAGDVVVAFDDYLQFNWDYHLEDATLLLRGEEGKTATSSPSEHEHDSDDDTDSESPMHFLESILLTTQMQTRFAARMKELMGAVSASVEGLMATPWVPDGKSASTSSGATSPGATSPGANVSQDHLIEAMHPLAVEARRAQILAQESVDLAAAVKDLEASARLALMATRWSNACRSVDGEHLAQVIVAIAQGQLSVSALQSDAGLNEEESSNMLAFIMEFASHVHGELLARGHTLEEDSDDDDGDDDNDTPDVEVTPPRFCVKLSYPDPVRVDDVFNLRITARNDHLVRVVLDTIDIDESFLRGFHIENITPVPSVSREEVDEVTLSFESAVEPADAIEVVLTLRALSEGNFAGEIRVWTDDIEDALAMPNIDVIGDVQ